MSEWPGDAVGRADAADPGGVHRGNVSGAGEAVTTARLARDFAAAVRYADLAQRLELLGGIAVTVTKQEDGVFRVRVDWD